MKLVKLAQSKERGRKRYHDNNNKEKLNTSTSYKIDNFVQITLVKGFNHLETNKNWLFNKKKNYSIRSGCVNNKERLSIPRRWNKEIICTPQSITGNVIRVEARDKIELSMKRVEEEFWVMDKIPRDHALIGANWIADNID